MSELIDEALRHELSKDEEDIRVYKKRKNEKTQNNRMKNKNKYKYKKKIMF